VSQTEINGREPQEISQVAEHLFRHEAGKMVATLTGLFGLEHLTLAEDVVQEALARALQTWPFYGVPQNPAAWLMQTARNRALDVVRREKNFREEGTGNRPADGGRRHRRGHASFFRTRKNHSFGGKYVELAPNERIRYRDRFDVRICPAKCRRRLR
jgi:DNA-directed RNA polymerase specialized sigma24 family protein